VTAGRGGAAERRAVVDPEGMCLCMYIYIYIYVYITNSTLKCVTLAFGNQQCHILKQFQCT